MEFQATIRVQRGPDGTLGESVVLESYMGTPTVQGRHYNVPVTLSGALSTGLPGFLDASDQPCFHYAMTGGQINFAADAAPPSFCKNAPSTQGYTTLDGFRPDTTRRGAAVGGRCEKVSTPDADAD